MTAPLSFSADFFMPPDTVASVPGPRATTVWEALAHKRDTDPAWWQALARAQFHCDARFLDVELALERVFDVNTCTSLYGLPVHVHLDPDADFTVEVYDVR